MSPNTGVSQHQKNVKLVKFNLLIKMATNMLAKKFEEQNEKEKDGEDKERKSRESRTKSGNKLEENDEAGEHNEDEVMIT